MFLNRVHNWENQKIKNHRHLLHSSEQLFLPGHLGLIVNFPSPLDIQPFLSPLSQEFTGWLNSPAGLHPALSKPSPGLGVRQEQECSHQYQLALQSQGPAWAPPIQLARFSHELAEVPCLQETQALAWLPRETPWFLPWAPSAPLSLAENGKCVSSSQVEEGFTLSSSELCGQKGTSEGGPKLILLVNLFPYTLPEAPLPIPRAFQWDHPSSAPVCDFLLQLRRGTEFSLNTVTFPRRWC